MKLSVLVLALFAMFLAVNGAYLRSGPATEQVVEDASGPEAATGSANATVNATGADEAEEAEKEDDMETKMKRVQEMNAKHEKAKKKFDELRDLTSKSAQVSKDSATEDSTSTRTRVAVDGSIFQNDRADKQLVKVRSAHKNLMDAKMDAGMVVGAKPKGPCHQKRVIFEKRISLAKTRATELDLKSKKLKAKAEASALALELKLKRANDAAASVKDQSSHMSMDGRLDSARNATIAAKAARDEAAMFKEEAARAQDASDDALEDAMKIQKEMRAILDICKNKQDFMKQQEKEMAEKEEAADGDKKTQMAAAAKEKKDATKKEAEIEAKKKQVEENEKAEKAAKKKEADAEKADTDKADAKKEEKDAKADPVKKAAKDTKKEEKSEGGDDKLAALQEQLAEAKATIAKLKAAKKDAAPPAAAAASGPAAEDKDEAAPAEEKAAPTKKPKVGSAELEKESTKHAVIVSAKAKLTGNIKESEQSGSKIVATSTAKHNRETVLETHVPIHHTSEVAMAGTAGPVISDKAPADMQKPTVVKQGSLNE
jgi:hypothetical protein